VGVTLDKGKRIVTGENFKTNVPNIFAIGDAIAGPMLAHKVRPALFPFSLHQPHGGLRRVYPLCVSYFTINLEAPTLNRKL